MPRALLWTPLAIGFSNKDASILLETIKPSNVTKSELVPCTMCTVAEPHNMRYRLRRCSCRSCTEEAPYAKCPWRAKTLHCEKVDQVDIYETSKHVTAMRAAPEPRLTSEMKVVAREMTAQGLKPVRIRNAILRKFNLAAEELPELSKIQRFCQHYASTKLGCNDYVKETHDLIRDAGYVSTMDEHESFTFALNADATGLPAVGIGSDDKPFIVGVTSRRLLMQADREARSLLLHVDATFKLNQVGYPSIVVGFSDCARTFHLLALFVSSQRKQEHFTEMFAALQQIYKRVIGKQLLIKMVMGDADDAQFNGVERVFGGSAEVKYLMCFYHVVAKVFEKTRALQPSHAKLVMTGVYDMHFSLSETEFLTTKARVLGEWAEVPELATFVTYFKAQWLAGRYTHWQVYHTPRGWATTNNPVEQYNRTIKRQYTLHTRLKMGALLGQFLTCCTAESLSDKPFATEATIPKSLVRRSKELAAAKLLHEYSPCRASIAFLLDEDAETGPPADCVRVISKPCPRIFDPEVGRTHEAIMVTAQQGVHLARMEVEGMPSTGWTVNTSSRSCSCRFFQKYAACIHLTHALSIRGLLCRGKRPTLVYRGSNKARRMQSETQAPGRPAQNGYALEIN